MFCQWVRNAGLKLWFCPWIQLQHVGMYVFGGSLIDLAQIGAAATADSFKETDVKDLTTSWFLQEPQRSVSRNAPTVFDSVYSRKFITVESRDWNLYHFLLCFNHLQNNLCAKVEEIRILFKHRLRK